MDNGHSVDVFEKFSGPNDDDLFETSSVGSNESNGSQKRKSGLFRTLTDEEKERKAAKKAAKAALKSKFKEETKELEKKFQSNMKLMDSSNATMTTYTNMLESTRDGTTTTSSGDTSSTAPASGSSTTSGTSGSTTTPSSSTATPASGTFFSAYNGTVTGVVLGWSSCHPTQWTVNSGGVFTCNRAGVYRAACVVKSISTLPISIVASVNGVAQPSAQCFSQSANVNTNTFYGSSMLTVLSLNLGDTVSFTTSDLVSVGDGTDSPTFSLSLTQVL